METKQTAVEWLKNNLIINGSGATTTFPELFEQAKAMEKEQIKDAYADGVARHFHEKVILSEEYYEKTYGK